MLTLEQYTIERAICDKAHAYWQAHATFDRNGWSSMSVALAEHPDYAACDNDMRGRVEQFEVLRDLPEHVTAYIGKRAVDAMGRTARLHELTGWTGLPFGTARAVSTWRIPNSHYGTHMTQYDCRIGGLRYRGRGLGEGMSINLRRVGG